MTWVCRIEPDDTWHFLTGRSHDDAAFAPGIPAFPPSARTVAGALRTSIGEAASVDWQRYNAGDGRAHLRGDVIDLRVQMGGADDLGLLRLRGPWVIHEETRLYPLPRFVVQSRSGAMLRLTVGTPSESDLGRVALPVAPEAGVKLLADAYVPGEALARVLEGGVPRADEIVSISDAFATENRLGIALDEARTAEEGMLYESRHLRPRSAGVGIEVDVSGIDGSMLPPKATVRFGGEGRVAHLRLEPKESVAPVARAAGEPLAGVILCLLTPADLDGGWIPADEGETPEAIEGVGGCAWRTVVGGQELVVRSGCLGPALREGGWDMAARKPRLTRSLAPSGSAWWCEVPDGDGVGALERLANCQIGRETELGRGVVAAGVWRVSESAAIQE